MLWLVSFLCVPKLMSAEGFSKHLQSRQGKDNVPGQESVVQGPSIPHGAGGIQLSCAAEGAAAHGPKGRSDCGGHPVLGERMLAQSCKPGGRWGTAGGPFSFGVGTPCCHF